MRNVLFIVAAGAVVACGGGGGDGYGYDYANDKGAAIYAELCQSCHGEAGEGGLGPALVDSPKAEGELREAIAARMPANDPGRCQGECASEVARFVKEGLTSRALRCEAVPPSARALRLLTRREYRATVRDLFGATAPAMACSRPTDCAYRDTCAAGSCEASPCDRHTFVFDPGGRTLTSVHVAGAFNGWAGTRAGGGWALTRDASGQWTGTFTVPEGESAYKLVLDEREWITDPRAPATVADGYGGQNSLLRATCASAGGVADPTAGFPIEPRPAGFPFDDHARSAVVTATHVDAYVAAAEALADDAADRKATLFPCDWGADRAGCARGLLERLGRRAFRRPLTGAELDRYAALASAGADADEALATALQAMLVSPSFLYRSELGEREGDHYRLTGFEMATALSYTLVGTTPDDALLDAAARGDLDRPDGLEREARRLLASPRARTQLGEVALQWLGGEAVLTADKRPDLFGDFTAATRAALARETRAFAAHVVFDGSGRFDELLTADYTILDGEAARFYGVGAPGPDGKVAYDGRRAGVLGHASVLAATAHSDQTSPIRRGLFVRRNLLCQELPPPPPFAGGVPDIDPNATTRDRFAEHTANPRCASCHKYIDGLGFGFEKLDPVGRWREQEAGRPIDASGTLTDVERLGSGTSASYQSVPELARLLAGSQAAPACFARQYYRFARGVRESLADRCARLAITQRFADAGHDVRELMIATFLSPDFAVRR